MFDFLFPTHAFGSQTLRLVAEAQQGGGDVFDIARTCREITEGDHPSWEREWIALAEREGGEVRMIETSNPPTRSAAMARLRQFFRDALAEDKTVFAGCDFPFG